MSLWQSSVLLYVESSAVHFDFIYLVIRHAFSYKINLAFHLKSSILSIFLRILRRPFYWLMWKNVKKFIWLLTLSISNSIWHKFYESIKGDITFKTVFYINVRYNSEYSCGSVSVNMNSKILIDTCIRLNIKCCYPPWVSNS